MIQEFCVISTKPIKIEIGKVHISSNDFQITRLIMHVRHMALEEHFENSFTEYACHKHEKFLKTTLQNKQYYYLVITLHYNRLRL